MDKDVESKMNRLCAFYLEAQARLVLLRPTKLPSGKSQRRTENQVADVLTELIEARRPRSAALVRLAYVRGMRGVKPESRITQDQEPEVAALIDQLNYRLRAVETQAMFDHRRHIRKLMLTKTLGSLGNLQAAAQLQSADQPLPLEQYARAHVRSIISMAETAGVLAATYSGDYDGAVNAQ